MLRVVPFQVDYVQVGLPDSETPGGAGYLGKEERVGEEEEERRGVGGMRKTQKTKHKYEGIDLRQSPCWTAAKPEPIAHPGWCFPQFRTRLAQAV